MCPHCQRAILSEEMHQCFQIKEEWERVMEIRGSTGEWAKLQECDVSARYARLLSVYMKTRRAVIFTKKKNCFEVVYKLCMEFFSSKKYRKQHGVSAYTHVGKQIHVWQASSSVWQMCSVIIDLSCSSLYRQKERVHLYRPAMLFLRTHKRTFQWRCERG